VRDGLLEALSGSLRRQALQRQEPSMNHLHLLLLTLISGSALAQPFAHEHARELDRQRVDLALRPGLFGPPVASALDYRDLSMQISLQPTTGAVTASMTIRVAGKTQPVSAVSMLIDLGLTLTSATLAGAPALITESPLGPTYNYVILEPTVSVPAGTEVSIVVSYSGTLKCLPYQAGSTPECVLGNVGFFNDGSIFPQLIDSASGLSGHDAFTRRLDLTLPSGTQVAASGNRISSTDDGLTLKTGWQVPTPLSRVLRFYVLTGMLTPTAIATTPPATLFTAASGAPFVSRLASWTPVALEAMESVAARKLPSSNLSLVLVPSSASFIGSASYAMTMLNESYAGLGDDGFEEIWAHENIHQWFGVLATPTDYEQSRLQTEGITTLLQYDATLRRTKPADPDLAMARRLRETELLLRYRFPLAATIPLWVADSDAVPLEPYLYNAWGYFKGAATLDALRLHVGTSAFEAGLRRYLDTCASPGACGLDGFQRALEGPAAGSLDKFFAQWIRGVASPRLSIGFTSAADNAVTVTIAQLQSVPAYVPLELWLTSASGIRRREAVVLETASVKLTFSSGEPIRSVQLNPRQRGLVQVQSVVEGDLDFDGELDGFDLLDCAWRIGRRPTAASSPGSLFGGDLDFEPQCDRDGDAVLTAADLAPRVTRFPELR